MTERELPTDAGRVSDGRSIIKPCFIALRPVHWMKNLLVATPVFFSGGLHRPDAVLKETIALAAFCLISSHVYVVNDLADVKRDRECGSRGRRPFAAGELTSREMLALALALLLAGFAAALFAGTSFTAVAAAYTALMHVYTFALKKAPGASMLVVPAGMVMRIFAGAAAISVAVSSWVYPVVFAASFYVALGKKIFYINRENGRSGAAANASFIFSGAASCILYILYAFSSVGPLKYRTQYLWVTIPFVAAAIIRYYFTAARPKDDRDHLDAMLSDPFLIIMLAVWIAVFAVLIYA